MDSSEINTIKLFLIGSHSKTYQIMRLITSALLCLFSVFAIGQDCDFLPSDTTVCGFKHNFEISDLSGSFSYVCEEGKNIAISLVDEGIAMVSFEGCGSYTIIFESAADGCLDTFRIEVADANKSVTTLDTEIELGYGDVDCPDGGVADCFSEVVSISLSSGTPEELWSFCTTASCQSTQYTTEVFGDETSCIVDSITCDTVVVFDSSMECVETDQDAFIVLNSDGDMVDDNAFLEYIAQLQAAMELECELALGGCNITNDENCIDSTAIDTSYIHIPVRIGGKWTLANIDSVELFDTTYFEYMGSDYELVLDPGVEFYGPGDLNVYLFEIFVDAMNDTTKNFPYGIQLELQWEEEWIIDTLQLIREIPIDTTGDCFVCGGNFFSANFNVPGIPDFPCGPVSIDYPDVCECEILVPNYSIQLLQCEPKKWQLDILDGEFEIQDVIGAFWTDGMSSTIISSPNTEVNTVLLLDNNGCDYELDVDLESIAEFVGISPSGSPILNCAVGSVTLDADVFTLSGLEIEFHDVPLWILPDGSEQMALSISATEPGTYRLVYEDAVACIHEATFDLVYDNEIQYFDDLIFLCGNSGVEYEGEWISEGGAYTIERACNEYVNLTVEQYDQIEYNESYEICQGEWIEMNGQIYSSGYYIVEMDNGTPCPDILHLEILETAVDVDWTLDSSCGGSTILTLSSSGLEGSYSIWSGGNSYGDYTTSGSDVNVELDYSGLYEVSFLSNGCIVSTLVDVHLMEYEIMTHADGLLDCDHACVLLSPEIVNHRGDVLHSDYSLKWSGPNGFTSEDIAIEVCESGIYSLTLEYGDVCAVSREIAVNEEFEPEIITISADLCHGECYDDGNYSFCETTQGIITIDDCTRLEVDIVVADEISTERAVTLCQGESILIDGTSYDEEGEYTEVLSSASGCDSIVLYQVEVLGSGEIISENILDCQHSEALLSYHSDDAEATYIWRDEDGMSISTDDHYLATTAGVYTLEITEIGKEKTCVHEMNYDLVEEIILPEIELVETYTLNCESSVEIDWEVEEGSSWIWTSEGGDLNVQNEALVTDKPGTYTLILTNEEGCSIEKSVEVLLVDPIELDLVTTASCEDTNEGTLNVRNIKGGMSPFTIMLDDEEIFQTATDLEVGVYELKIMQADGCVYSEEVVIESIPVLDEIPEQELEYCNNQGVTITLNLNEMISYAWLDGYEGTERQIRQEGMYEVELSNGCSSITSTYHVKDTREEEAFVVSNIFSPDGNSTNDRMKVMPQVGYEDFEMYVFSRDGSLVYRTDTPEEGWDGKIGGNPAVLGTYVWMIEAEVITCSGEVEHACEMGTVMVLR